MSDWVDSDGSPPQHRDDRADLCAAFLETLPVDGVSITLFARDGAPSTVCVSDAIAARVEELHFELGEGPYWETLRSGKPISVANTSTADSSRWPVFASAIQGAGIGALHAMPLSLGASTVGAVGLYRRLPGELSSLEVARGLALAALTVAPAMRLAIEIAQEEVPPAEVPIPETRREVHQAIGMIIAQLGINATEGFARLRAYAFATGRSVQHVASDILARDLDFRDLEPM